MAGHSTHISKPKSDGQVATSLGRPTILEQPLVAFGSDVVADLQAGLRREWLVTNGLGGHASSTLVGINTRRYHGLLVAALAPPVERTVLVGDSVDWATTYDAGRYPLSSHEYSDGTIDPVGFRQLTEFRLEGGLPVWRFGLADAVLERRVWMAYGANTTYIRYQMLRASEAVDLHVTPLVTYCGFHTLSRGAGWQLDVAQVEDGIEIHAFDGAVPFRILQPGANFTSLGVWYWNFYHREEAARGLDDQSDLYAPGTFAVHLRAGESATLILTTESHADLDSVRALDAERWRQRSLLEQASAAAAHPVVQQLVLAADQFIVERRTGGQPGKTVIAGYHWFND